MFRLFVNVNTSCETALLLLLLCLVCDSKAAPLNHRPKLRQPPRRPNPAIRAFDEIDFWKKEEVHRRLKVACLPTYDVANGMCGSHRVEPSLLAAAVAARCCHRCSLL
jgi:hypothetical protein